MREDDMLRLSLDCARMAVRGEDYASLLAEGVYRILDADAGVGVTRFPVLGIAERTVRKHLENVSGKLEVQNLESAGGGGSYR